MRRVLQSRVEKQAFQEVIKMCKLNIDFNKYKNVAIPRRKAGISRVTRHAALLELLKQLGLADDNTKVSCNPA